jgi:hypothetical protein
MLCCCWRRTQCVHHLIVCKGVRPNTIRWRPALGVVYIYMGYHPCFGIHVPCLKIHDIALRSVYHASRSMTLHWDMYTMPRDLWHYIRIRIPCLEIYDTTFGSVYHASRSMTLHWDPYTMPWDLWHYIGIHDIALGLVYLYIEISTNIGIHAIFVGIHVLHLDMCNYLGIPDSALVGD